MAVVNVKPKWSDREAAITSRGKTDQITYSVLLDGRDTLLKAPYVARQATGVPRVGQSHPDDQWLVCTDVSPKPVSRLLYEVTCRYEQKTLGFSGGASPLDQPPMVGWSSQTVQVAVDVDADGKPICNAVGDPFDPPPPAEVEESILTITRNDLAVSDATFQKYNGSVNLNPYRGWAAGCAKLRMSVEEVTEGTLKYCRVRFEIHFRHAIPGPDGKPIGGFMTQLINQGYRERTSAAYAGTRLGIVEATDDEGRPASRPVLLDKSGCRITDASQAVKLVFKLVRLVDWSGLRLP